MQATDVLREEHRIIERMLDSLEAAANRLAAGEAVRPKLFIMAADFIKGFADGCHHHKEEDLLFPAMQAAGVPAHGGPIAVMLAEHEEGRHLTAGMRAAAEKLAAGDTGARDGVVRHALGYVDLLRAHIAKENNILFAIADRVIGEPARSELAEAFERAEREETGEGVHEKFVALVGDIEKALAP